MNGLTLTLRPRDQPPQVSAVEGLAERLGTEVGEQRVREWPLAEEERTETPRVAKPERAAAVEPDVEMVVNARRRVLVDDENAARHAEVHDGRAVVGYDEQVLGASFDRVDATSAQFALDTTRHGPAQAAIAHDDVVNARTDDPGFDAAAACLDFGEFGHGGIVPKKKPAVSGLFLI